MDWRAAVGQLPLISRPPHAGPETFSRWTQRLRRRLFRTLLLRTDLTSGRNWHLDRIAGLEVSATSRVIGETLARARPPSWGEEFVWQDPGESQTPMTGYGDLYSLLSRLALAPGSTFCELGAGFGRAGLLIGAAFPHLRYVGYELVEPRVEAAERAHRTLGLDARVSFLQADLSRWSPTEAEDAEVYYVFCSFCEATGRHVLNQLERVARRRPIELVLNLGMFGFEPAETPWLELREQFGIFTRYSSR